MLLIKNCYVTNMQFHQTQVVGIQSGQGLLSVTKRLATFSPTFSILFDKYDDSLSAFSRNLSELAEGARTLVYQQNRRYSAKLGEILSKHDNGLFGSTFNHRRTVPRSRPIREFD